MGVILGQSMSERIAGLREDGLASERKGDGKAALVAYQNALALDACNLDILILVGNLYKRLRQPDAARRTYQQALVVAPACIEAHFNLATLDQDAANYPEAIQAYQRVLQAPGITQAWHNLVACLTYAPETPRAAVKAALIGFDRCSNRPYRPRRDFKNDFDSERRLRIGYVSADFRAHPVAYLALPLIEGHDRTRFR